MNRTDQDNITSLMSQVYTPSVPEKKLKARFWSTWTDGPSKGDPTAEDAVRIVGKPEKFSNPVFVDWFLNTREMVETLHFAQSLVMDMLVEGIQDPELRFSDKLKAAAMVWDMTKAHAPKAEVVYADAELAQLSDDELEKKMAKLEK